MTQLTKVTIHYVWQDDKAAEYQYVHELSWAYYTVFSVSKVLTSSEVYFDMMFSRYLENAGREKISSPSRMLQSWHPVAILMLIPIMQFIVSRLSA